MKIPIEYIKAYIEPKRKSEDVAIIQGIHKHKYGKSVSRSTIYSCLNGEKVSPEICATVLYWYNL